MNFQTSSAHGEAILSLCQLWNESWSKVRFKISILRVPWSLFLHWLPQWTNRSNSWTGVIQMGFFQVCTIELNFFLRYFSWKFSLLQFYETLNDIYWALGDEFISSFFFFCILKRLYQVSQLLVNNIFVQISWLQLNNISSKFISMR